MCSHFLRLSVSLAGSLLKFSHFQWPFKMSLDYYNYFFLHSLVTHTGNLSARPGPHGNTDFMWNELPGTKRGHSQRPGCQKLCVSAISHVLTLFTILHLLLSTQEYTAAPSVTLWYWLFKKIMYGHAVISIIVTMTGWLDFFTFYIYNHQLKVIFNLLNPLPFKANNNAAIWNVTRHFRMHFQLMF